MPTVIVRTPSSTLPSDQTREIRLARTAISRLAPGFTRELRQSLICELLGRLSADKRRRQARNLNHWDDYAKTRTRTLAEELLAERAERITAHMKATWDRWDELAWRVTRSAALVDQAIAKTTWELWEGRTHEEVSSRALLMNARDLLESRRAGSRRAESLDSMVAVAGGRGESLDFPSHRLDDKDPLDILIAREEQKETDDELTYAIENVGQRGNRWILRKDWWKSSGLAKLQRTLRGTDFGGSPE